MRVGRNQLKDPVKGNGFLDPDRVPSAGRWIQIGIALKKRVKRPKEVVLRGTRVGCRRCVTLREEALQVFANELSRFGVGCDVHCGAESGASYRCAGVAQEWMELAGIGSRENGKESLNQCGEAAVGLVWSELAEELGLDEPKRFILIGHHGESVVDSRQSCDDVEVP